MNNKRDHAIVIGASIAGMFAAKALSQHFNTVTIIERDILPDEPTPRGGVPQSRHVHQLLMGGLQVMRRLFPGIDDDLEALGATPIHLGYNTVTATRYGFMPPVRSDVYSYACSRPGLEYVIRKRIWQTENITVKGGYTVKHLLATDDQRVVTGVAIKQKRTRTTETVTGDLVVDASGRTSKADQWLQSLGYDAPEVTYVDGHVGYATCWFEKPDYAPEGVAVLLSLGDQENPRSGLIIEAEGDKWLALVSSKDGDYPPNDLDGFLDFAKSCASPLAYNYLKGATPISPVYGYRRTQNHWRHYEKLTNRPENFIITGDAACAFNPIYGQGMSVAALDAQLLDDILARYPYGRKLTGFANEFQKELGKQVALPFNLASADDRQHADTDDSSSAQAWLMQQVGAYFQVALGAMFIDDYVRTRFMQVSNLVAPPTTLFTPQMIARILRIGVQARLAPDSLPSLPQESVLNVKLEPELPAPADAQPDALAAAGD